MKFRFNPKYTQIAVYAVIVIVVSGFLLMSVSAFPDLAQMFSLVGACLTPVIWGIVIAYLLNPGVEFFRTKIFRRWNENAKTVRSRRAVRNISITVTVILAVGLITALLFLIIPQLISSIAGFIGSFDDYTRRFTEWANDIFKDQPQVLEALGNPMAQLESLLSSYWAEISQTVLSFGSKIGGGVLNVFIGLKDFIIGFIIAIYLLISKDLLKSQAKKILFAVFRNSRVQSILHVSARANDIFIHYVTSVLIDAFFVGCVTFVGATLIGTPFPLLMAVIIGVTNIIPFFGPFIGAIPCCFFTLLYDPMKCLWLAIFILVLQQVDGNIIKPLLYGETMGLPAVWVLLSIIIGGGLFGFVGMLLSVPVFAIIYMLFKELLEIKLEKKGLPPEGAVYSRQDTDKYVDGYEYSEKEKKADEEWLREVALDKKKKLPKLLHPAITDKIAQDKNEKNKKEKKG